MNFSNNVTRTYLKTNAFGTNLSIAAITLADSLIVNSTTISSTLLSYLSGLTGNIQTQIDSISTENTATTIEVGTVTTEKSDATVTNSGDSTNAVFDFVIPYVDLVIGTVKSVTSTPTVTVDTSTSTTYSKVLNFELVKGDTGAAGTNGTNGSNGLPGATGANGSSATISVGTTSTTSSAGASVTNSGTSLAAIFDFVVPYVTFDIGTVTSGVTPTVAFDATSTTYSKKLNFQLQKGDDGATGATGTTGANGSSATISVGTTSVTSSAGASVTNSGTSLAAIFDFIIPYVTFDIGTVTSGTTAAVTIDSTSTTYSKKLNFQLPKGADGVGLTSDTFLSYISSAVMTTGAKKTVAATLVSLQEQIDTNYNIEKEDGANQQDQINDNLANYKDDKSSMNTKIAALAALEAADVLAIGVTTGLLEGQIITLGKAVAATDRIVAVDTVRVDKLVDQTSHQSASLIGTDFLGNLIVSDKDTLGLNTKEYVVLNEATTHYNKFTGKSYFNDVEINSGNVITTSAGGDLFLGDLQTSRVQVLVHPQTGTITLSGQSIILNASSVDVNAITFNVNALCNLGTINTSSQWAVL